MIFIKKYTKKFIYKITNKINGNAYIGQAVDVQRRFYDHISGTSENYKSLIHQAIEKYGEENFDFEILGEFENYNEMEQKFIIQYNTLAPNGYNIQSGGEEPPVRYGEDNNACKYSDEQVLQAIRAIKDNPKKTLKQIGDELGISTDVMNDINQGESRRQPNEKYPIRSHNASVIQEDEIDQIIDLLLHSNLTQKEIGAKFGRGRTTITAINNGKNHRRDNLTYPLRTGRVKK